MKFKSQILIPIVILLISVYSKEYVENSLFKMVTDLSPEELYSMDKEKQRAINHSELCIIKEAQAVAQKLHQPIVRFTDILYVFNTDPMCMYRLAIFRQIGERIHEHDQELCKMMRKSTDDYPRALEKEPSLKLLAQALDGKNSLYSIVEIFTLSNVEWMEILETKFGISSEDMINQLNSLERTNAPVPQLPPDFCGLVNERYQEPAKVAAKVIDWDAYPTKNGKGANQKAEKSKPSRKRYRKSKTKTKIKSGL